MGVNLAAKLILAARYGENYSEPLRVFGHWAVCADGIFGLAVPLQVEPDWYGQTDLTEQVTKQHGRNALGFDRALAFARELQKGKVAA